MEMPLLYLGSWAPAVILTVHSSSQHYTNSNALNKAAFDVFVFLLLLLNALSRPRGESERLLKVLYGDGILFFLVRTFIELTTDTEWLTY